MNSLKVGQEIFGAIDPTGLRPKSFLSGFIRGSSGAVFGLTTREFGAVCTDGNVVIADQNNDAVKVGAFVHVDFDIQRCLQNSDFSAFLIDKNVELTPQADLLKRPDVATRVELLGLDREFYVSNSSFRNGLVSKNACVALRPVCETPALDTAVIGAICATEEGNFGQIFAVDVRNQRAFAAVMQEITADQFGTSNSDIQFAGSSDFEEHNRTPDLPDEMTELASQLPNWRTEGPLAILDFLMEPNPQSGKIYSVNSERLSAEEIMSKISSQELFSNIYVNLHTMEFRNFSDLGSDKDHFEMLSIFVQSENEDAA